MLLELFFVIENIISGKRIVKGCNIFVNTYEYLAILPFSVVTCFAMDETSVTVFWIEGETHLPFFSFTMKHC
jgi:hypothetical protein